MGNKMEMEIGNDCHLYYRFDGIDKQKAPQEHTPLPHLVWREWSDITKTAQNRKHPCFQINSPRIIATVSCMMSNPSWKLQENPFIHFFHDVANSIVPPKTNKTKSCIQNVILIQTLNLNTRNSLPFVPRTSHVRSILKISWKPV